MGQTPVYFSLSHGLRGCYMPDTMPYAYCVATRRDLADIIRSELEMYDAPRSRFRSVHIRDLWQRFQHARSASSWHFDIDTTEGYALHFGGMTKDEYDDAMGGE